MPISGTLLNIPAEGLGKKMIYNHLRVKQKSCNSISIANKKATWVNPRFILIHQYVVLTHLLNT